MTNNEKINNMSAEEKANLLMKKCLCIDYRSRRCEYDTWADCKECLIDWLNEEVGE